MAIKDVTHGQLEEVKRLARDAGVGRELFQTELLNKGSLAALLRRIGDKKTASDALVPPEGGRVHIVRVPVNLSREWQEAINAGGLDTPDNYNVRKVGDQYPASGDGVAKETEVILMNFGPGGGNWDRAVAWANQYRLKRTNPCHSFAIGEHKPELHTELGFDYMYVVATEECTFAGHRYACYVWWYRSERECDLYRRECYGLSDDWFAFLRE